MSVDYELLLELFPPTVYDYFIAFATLALLITTLVIGVKIFGVLEARYLSHRALQIETQGTGIKRKWFWDLTLYETFQIIINCARKNLGR